MKYLAIVWGIGGVLAMLVFALWRLIPNSAMAFDQELQWYHWTILVVNTLIMAYYEGFKGFQKAFSPRVAARARYLYDQGTTSQLLFAPFFCMAFYAAPRRRIIATWILTVSIIILVLLFQTLSQPIRGILDAGVVVGLGWGVVATTLYCFAAFASTEFNHSPEVNL